METTYRITGMTCGHCVAHVKEEVSGVPGVEKVDVVLDGRMTVTSATDIDFAVIQEAVAEAGDYTVALV
ncbi:MAG: cation transporter [Propionibacteriaceae bacterium]|nr:cation transporter [Propionibacteriaceae bacterium]